MRRVLAALALALVLPLPVRADVTVKPGDTLGEIAERYGVSVNRLMQANGIQDPKELQAGQRLVIPGRNSGGGGGGGSGSRGSTGSVVVQPGDTLSEIAERNGISLERLMQLNGISNPAMVEAGRRLVLAGGGSTSAGSLRRGGSGTPASGGYTVKSGETLGEIAERHNTSVNRLMLLNDISDPTQLQAGSRIVVPGMRPVPGNPTRPGGTKEHVVQPGESLSEIADSYNLPIEKLVSLNRISDPNLVISGTRLKLTAPPPVPGSRQTPRPPRNAPSAAATRPAPARAPAVATSNASPGPSPARPRPTPSSSGSPPTNPTPSSVSSPTPASRPSTTAVAATAAPRSGGSNAAANAGATTVAARQTPSPRPTTPLASRPAAPDWRTYGALQVDWASWQPMGGSFVTPSLTAEGLSTYTAINCGARKLNVTGQGGQWRTWEPPRNDAEQQLVSDLCKANGS
ncbi:MAG: LysM peptidoglycan-binding domain-containing protein [Cyanobacteriota bacterium]